MIKVCVRVDITNDGTLVVNIDEPAKLTDGWYTCYDGREYFDAEREWLRKNTKPFIENLDRFNELVKDAFGAKTELAYRLDKTQDYKRNLKRLIDSRK